jgi:glycosyltransferase involved in cell wall biosynthesis
LALRILQICNKPPLPAIDGGTLAMWRMSQGLSDQGHDVTILSVHTEKHPWLPQKIGEENIRKYKMDSVYIDTNVKWLPAFLWLFKTSSYNIERFHNLGFEARLIEILSGNKFDIVQLESLYVCPYIATIRRVSKAKIVLRAHNTESAIWQKNADEETEPFKKMWYRDLAGKLERYEKKIVNEVDAILPITNEDMDRLKKLGATKPMYTATFAMSNPASQPRTENRELSTVFHIGAMDWKPNHDGVHWLVNDIWPIVLQSVPDAKLHLAGKSMSKTEFSGKAGVIPHGEVADANEFMSQYNIMAIPLRSGGGVKVKVIEGMFAGKAIVTTKIGSEGIAMRDKHEFLLATTTQEFADHLVTLLRNDKLASEIGQNAQKCAAENHELSRVTKKLSDFYTSILR